MGADEPRFSHANGRTIHDHPQMARNAKAAGMGDARTIAEDEIGGEFQLRQSRQQGGQFAKGQ
jgi:hypothetical protein